MSSREDYDKLEQAYQIYRKIGGYPQVVTTYLRSRNTLDCMVVLGDLVRTFTVESSRFFSNSTALSIFNEVYRAVMVRMAEEKKGTGKSFLEFITNFVKDSVKEPVSRNEVKAASSWLLYSGMIDKGFKAAPTVGGHGERFDTIPVYLVGVGFPYADK